MTNAGVLLVQKRRIAETCSLTYKKDRAFCAVRVFTIFFFGAIYCLIVNVPSFTKRERPFVPSDTAFSLAPTGVPLIKSEPTVVIEPFSLLTSV